MYNPIAVAETKCAWFDGNTLLTFCLWNYGIARMTHESANLIWFLLFLATNVKYISLITGAALDCAGSILSL